MLALMIGSAGSLSEGSYHGRFSITPPCLHDELAYLLALKRHQLSTSVELIELRAEIKGMDARIIAVYDYVVLRPEEQVVFLHNPSLLRRLCHAQLITRSTHDRSRLQYDDPVVFVDVVGMDRDEVTKAAPGRFESGDSQTVMNG